MDTRHTLISTGEHMFAVAKMEELRVGDSYSPEAYLKAVELGRELGAGEAHARKVLGETSDDDVVSGVGVLADGRVVVDGRVRS
jgi:hypothetical protein